MRPAAFLFSLSLPLSALTIEIDYSLDSNGFFGSGNPQGSTGGAEARAALEAAAARWSAIINETLEPVNVPDNPSADIRLSLPDPSRFEVDVPPDGVPSPNPGAVFDLYEISSAASIGSDSFYRVQLNNPANRYDNGITIAADTFRIFVGGRPFVADGFTAGLITNNHDSVINDENSFLNRGFNNGPTSLPVWGSSISFNSLEDWLDDSLGVRERRWHFDHTTPVPFSSRDFYSVALREIGHALGVGLFYQDWRRFIDGNQHRGPFTRAAYLEENNTPIVGLNLQGPDNRYFQRDAYSSNIFPGGNPNYVGTVGPGVPQPILFQARRTFIPGVDPQNFVPGIAPGERYEVTNLDVAVIQDLGWSVIASAPEFDVPFVTLARDTNGQVTLTFPSQVGASYTIQTSTDLSGWRDVTPELSSEGSTTDWVDGEAGFSDPLGPAFLRRKKFYRIIENE